VGGSAAALTATRPKPCLYSETDITGQVKCNVYLFLQEYSLEILIASGTFHQDGSACAEVVERSECLAGVRHCC
jgi:hypothetical protein